VQQLPDSLPTPPATPRSCGRVTVTRGQQTELGDEEFDEEKKSLEDRIQELEIALEVVQKNELRDKQTIAKLQKQLARRESAQRDADRERRLRADSESRAKQALQEAARCKSRLKLLTTEFTRMEETVRSMLVYKKQAEQLRQEKNALTLAFENRCQQYQNTISRLNNEILSLRQQLAQAGSEYNPEEILHAHAAALHRHAEESRKQYERCLDDVANQVVKALLAQKGLREEVGVLNNRIHELESQNRALTSMLVHQLRGDTPPEPEAKPATPEDSNPSTTVVKHYNSFNSEVLDETPTENRDNGNETALSRIERRLSANSEILGKDNASIRQEFF
jgi:chromosome segregation ATPase